MALSLQVSFLQVGCPWPISIIGTLEGGPADETSLLRKFAQINMRGEWFHPADELLGFIALNANSAVRAKPVLFECPGCKALTVIRMVNGDATYAVDDVNVRFVSQG